MQKHFNSNWPAYLTRSVITLLFMFVIYVRAQSDPRASNHDELMTWTKPRPGWLLVLDYPDSADYGSVLLFDPSQKKVMGRIKVGGVPEMITTGDGRLLFVAALLDEGDTLSIIDLSSGKNLGGIPVKDRWQYTVRPESPIMSVSPDGNWLYMLKRWPITRGHDAFSVAVLDVQNQRFLPKEVDVANCMSGILVPYPDNANVALACFGTNDIRLLKRTDDGLAVAKPGVLMLRLPQDTRLRTLTITSQGNSYAVTNDGQVFGVDLSSGDLQKVSDPKRSDLWVPNRPVVLSGDETKLYFAATTSASRSSGDGNDVFAVDLGSTRTPLVVQTGITFWSFAVSGGGDSLYFLDPRSGTLTAIDRSETPAKKWATQVGQNPVSLRIIP